MDRSKWGVLLVLIIITGQISTSEQSLISTTDNIIKKELHSIRQTIVLHVNNKVEARYNKVAPQVNHTGDRVSTKRNPN